MEKSLKTQLEKGQLTSGSTISYWIDSIEHQNFPKLSADTYADVLIVGAGNAGLTIAYQLLKSGKSVTVVEDGFIGSGETGRTSAHLTAVLDSRYFELRRIYGKDKMKLIAASHMDAIELIEKISETEKIDCGFQRVSGYLFLHPTDIRETLTKESEAATEAGLETYFHDKVPFLTNTPGPCLEFKHQAKVHPLKYLQGLANSVIKNGGRIYTGTHAQQINERGIVSRDGFSIRAEHVVIATNSPVNNKYLMHLRQYPYRTYMIGARVAKGAVADALFWDTGNKDVNSSFEPYHYVRIEDYDDDYDLLLCGGADHPTGLIETSVLPDEQLKYRALEHWARERFPMEDVIYEWSGQVIYAFDDLGHIGRNPMDKDNIYIVTGDCGNGLTYGAIAGMLIPDLIDGKENEYADLYRPSRFKFLRAGKVFLDELISGLSTYLKTKNDYNVDSLEEIQAGEGKIIEVNGKKYGVSRGYDDIIDIVASECTHLGCTIKWNSDELTWDCPCHGSRFTNKGTVINGPANINLNHHMIRESDFKTLKSQLK